jgi:hypothetical protein
MKIHSATGVAPYDGAGRLVNLALYTSIAAGIPFPEKVPIKKDRGENPVKMSLSSKISREAL